MPTENPPNESITDESINSLPQHLVNSPLNVDNDVEAATSTTAWNSEVTNPIPVAANVILLDEHDNDEQLSSSTRQPPLHARMNEDDIPIVHAIFQEEDKPDTIRLDSTHIVSVRNADPRQQPEFASIILVNRPAYADFDHASKGIMGITLQAKPDGMLVISNIDPSSPFAETCMQIGHILMSINQTNCVDMDSDTALAALLGAVTTANNNITIIRLHYLDGAPVLVATTAEKATQSAKLGVTFGLNARGSVLLTNVSATGVLANSLLNDRDRVLSVNGQDCSNIAIAATLVASWVKQAPRFVTIVTETTTSTGVVIAMGDQSVRSNIQTAGVVVQSTTTNSNAASEQSRQGSKAVCALVVFVLFMIFIGVVVSVSGQDDDGYYHYGGGNYYTQSPTQSPTANPGCLRAADLPVDGTMVWGNNQYSQFASNQDCPFSYYAADTGRGSWFTFTPQDFEYFEVVTCSDSLFDTVVTVYESHTGSCENLSCVGSSDRGGHGYCNEASSFDFRAYPGSTYYALVQGRYYQTGSFGIRLKNATDYGLCNCGARDDSMYSPTFAPTGFRYDSPSPSHFLATSAPTDRLTLAPTTE